MQEKIQKLFTSQNAVLILFVVLAVSLIINTFGVIQKNYSLQQDVDELSDKVALVELQNQNLKYNIAYYETDAYLEIEAKRRFNLAAAGESVILLPKDGEPVVEADTDDLVVVASTDDKSNFEQWMAFLSGEDN